MMTRIISGGCLTIIAVASNYLGGPLLIGVLLVCSLIGLFELLRACGVLPAGKWVNAPAAVGYISTIAYYLFLFLKESTGHLLFVIVSMIVLTMLVYVFAFPKYHATQIAYCVFGFLYVPVLLGFIYLVRGLENGTITVWLIYIVSWVCDTFAYLVGIAIGKHKLCPKLSPKKSIEGAIGGIAGSVLAGFLFSYFLLEKQMPGSTVRIMIVCAIGAIVSQTGDLAASAIKRNHNIKDYGRLIPGHGGILDRFDSVIFSAPMIYFLLVFILHGNF
ncbi:MAG: phosphatidate cytidylyltransferase [Lachnospiraceae bacterium]|nr:phosphatidate cytidylyltransferase [Lachnospiraceae bacterium]